MVEKTFKKVCQCEKCGNEAEMTITCTLEPEEDQALPEISRPRGVAPQAGQRKGHAVCSHCGNEADIWLEM